MATVTVVLTDDTEVVDGVVGEMVVAVEAAVRNVLGPHSEWKVEVTTSSLLSCGHKRYGHTQHCAELSCRNYVSKFLYDYSEANREADGL